LWRRLACLLLAGACLLALDDRGRPAPLPAAQTAWHAGVPATSAGELVEHGRGAIPMPADTPAAHASTLLALPEGEASALLAFWFAGQQESAPDVRIAASAFDRQSQRWTAARFVVDRHVVGAALGFGVRRLGNPVAWLDAQGRVHLFVVATGMGGWAASRILHLRQANAGHELAQLRFEPVRVLPLSWLWNTSHLVRSAPMPLRDGGMVLPVYFELGVKYPVALRFDAHGEFRGLARMSRRQHLLQPTLLALSDTRWLGLLRDQSPQARIGVVQTLDGGQSWQDLPSLALRNDDASVACLALRPGVIFLAHNTLAHSRAVLALSRSTDGLDWTQALVLEGGKPPDEFSYPAMAWADNELWVSYTDQRKRIAWQRFSWVQVPK
jgi:predicted neuraminidase